MNHQKLFSTLFIFVFIYNVILLMIEHKYLYIIILYTVVALGIYLIGKDYDKTLKFNECLLWLPINIKNMIPKQEEQNIVERKTVKHFNSSNKSQRPKFKFPTKEGNKNGMEKSRRTK